MEIAKRRHCRSLIAAAAFCLLLSITPRASAQGISIQEVVRQKAQWKQFAEEGRKIQFEGRFQGRADDAFQLSKFDLPCRLPASIKLPDRMKMHQCLDVTGKFILNEGRLAFLVSRLIVRETDLEQLSKQVASLPSTRTAELLSLAAKYDSIAEYYGDRDLKMEVSVVRTMALNEKRKNANGIVSELEDLLKLAQSLKVDDRLLQTISFEILYLKWQNSKTDAANLMGEVKQLEAWDRIVPEPAENLKTQFEKKAVKLYDEGSDADRLALHRLFYITLRRAEIRALLKQDGSNGLSLAELVRREFPSEAELVAELEQREIDFRLDHVEDLSRPQLQQLIVLLERLGRQNQVAGIVQKWLSFQERQVGTESLAGLLRMADEYLFVAELRKEPAMTEKAIDFLKQAWLQASTSSPDDAHQIADRLKRLGWEHLNGQWMTFHQIAMLPKDDIQLAVREGRVVRGMTQQQVSQTLGQPVRISRIGSGRSMRELWIYNSEGTAGMVVRLRQNPLGKSDSKVVEEVSRFGQ